MSDDLVKRLRAYEGKGFETTACYNGTRSEAAGRIEELEAKLAEALREMKAFTDVSCYMQRSASYKRRQHENGITDTIWSQWSKQLKSARTTIASLQGEQP